MKTVDQLVNEVIGREGGYSNHPSDRGGETNWGITAAVARQHGYSGPMRGMPRDAAAEIYKRIYWLRPGFDKVAEIFPLVAEEMFDTGVNCGPSIAAKFLQRALSALNRRGRDYPDLKADGRIGPATIGALKAFRSSRAMAGEIVLLRALECQQGTRYIEIAEARPANEDFLYGWLSHRIGNVR